AQPELAVGLDGPHELVRHADGVVGVLVLDAGDVLAAEVHVEPGVPQRADLVLLARLGLDELLDVGVVDVQHDHLRGPAGRAARLDRPGGRVGAAHERDGPAGGAAGREQFLAGADAGEVEAGAGAALEDDALFLVPVQNGLHRVVHRQDEAGAHLLRRLGAHVEPDGRVEAEELVDQRVLQLVLEDLGVLVGGEIALLPAGLHVHADHAVDELLQAPFALRRADRSAEVLGRDDVDGVQRPEVGELDAALLEVDRAVAPVGHDDVTTLPAHLVVRMHAGGGENALDLQAFAAPLAAPGSRAAHRLRHDLPPLGPSRRALYRNNPAAARGMPVRRRAYVVVF